MRFIPGGPTRYRHQRKGLRRILKTNGVCALLMDPGTGKTATALDFASILALKKGEARVLVVAPLAAIDTWVIQSAIYVSPQVDYWAEALGSSIKSRYEALAARNGQPYRGTKAARSWDTSALHAGRSIAISTRGIASKKEGPAGLAFERPRLIIEVINLDTLTSRQAVGSATMADKVLNGIKRFDPHLVIVDESHKMKSPAGNASRLLSRLAPHIPYRLILTGTVMPHSPMDVYSQWRFLLPEAFGDDGNSRINYTTFKERYAVLGGFMGRQIIGYQNLDHLQSVMAKNSIVVRKADALDLPKTTDVVVPVHLGEKERKAYDEMLAECKATMGDEASTAHSRLTQRLRLRQIVAGHLPTDSGTIEVLGTSMVDTIVSIAQDTLAQENRIVIFSFFTHEIQELSRRLSVPGTQVLTIDGSTKTAERLRMREHFGSEDPTRLIMVAQVKTISISVNELVTASNAIFGSLSEQRDDLIQARDRLDRIGQTRPVTFWFAVAQGTVSEVILDSHAKRTNLEDAILAHIRGDATEADSLVAMQETLAGAFKEE